MHIVDAVDLFAHGSPGAQPLEQGPCGIAIGPVLAADQDQRSEQARIGSIEVLRDSLEDLLHRACQPRKEDNAALAAMQQSVFP